MLNGIRENAFSPEDILQKEDVRRKLYFLESYVNDAKMLLSRFEDAGYLQK